MQVSFVYAYAHPIGEYEKDLFFPLYGNMENLLVTLHALRID